MAAAQGSIAIVAVALLISCSYSPAFPSCAIRCGADQLCPDGTSCRADKYCHARAEPLCGAVEAGGGEPEAGSDTGSVDGATADAPLTGPDGAATADAAAIGDSPDVRPCEPGSAGSPCPRPDAAGAPDAPSPDIGPAADRVVPDPLDTAPARPPAPSGVRATAGDGKVILAWAGDASSFNVYYASSAGVSDSSPKLAATSTPYLHGGLNNGTRYYYRIAAVGAGVESLLSEEVSATPAAPASPPSCAGLPATCSTGDDCCASPAVPGGSFNLDNDSAHLATVLDFRLDRYEITVGRFRKFVEAGKGTQANPPGAGEGSHPVVAGTGWNPAWNSSLVRTSADLRSFLVDTSLTWTDTVADEETRPITGLTWFEAFAFCIWDGGRLPSELEWSYAATGGSEQRDYPWGSGIDFTRASYMCGGGGGGPCFIQVGSKRGGDGRWGQADLAGNAAEWVLDWVAPYPALCNNCLQTGAGLTLSNRGFRGGTSYNDPLRLLNSMRDGDSPNRRNPYGGARCARLP